MIEDFDKYLAIANHDIQVANNKTELKSYVASILYDNDKKVEIINKQHSIIKEVREYIEKYDFITGYYEYNYDDENDTYTHYTVKEELLEILDKESEVN